MLRRMLAPIALAATALVGTAQTGSARSGNINSALQKMDNFVHYAMNRTHVPGVAVAVVYKDQVVFLKGYGVRKEGDAAPVDPDTVFEIASLSKPIASTIVASLVGTGEVSWDDRIETLDPGFRLSNKAASEQVTVRDLFSHRSGLPTESGDRMEDLGFSRPEILHQMRLVPLAGPFRTSYHYSNFGLTEAAIAAAKKTGKTWEEVAEDRLYERIGMRSTSSRFSDYDNNPNKAALHVLVDGVYTNRFVREADSESPAGGVSSNVRDLAQWLRLQLAGGAYNGQQVVAREALEETHKPEICNASAGPLAPGYCPGNKYYGLGWNVGKDSEGRTLLSHSGAFLLGTGTTVMMIPSEQIGIVVLSNTTPIGVPESIAISFLDYFRYGYAKQDYLTAIRPYFDELERETQDSSINYLNLKPPQSPIPAKPLDSYKGTYVNPYYGKLQIHVQRNKLIMRLPPRGAYYELSHWDGDTFTYYFASENTGTGRRGVVFKGNQVTVQNFAVQSWKGSGVFTKVN